MSDAIMNQTRARLAGTRRKPANVYEGLAAGTLAQVSAALARLQVAPVPRAAEDRKAHFARMLGALAAKKSVETGENWYFDQESIEWLEAQYLEGISSARAMAVLANRTGLSDKDVSALRANGMTDEEIRANAPKRGTK
jgi:hypothetical protein